MYMAELKVGDVLYYIKYGFCSNKHVIDRVTNKMAFAGNIKFRKEYDRPTYIKELGSQPFSGTYSMETPELKDQYFRQGVISTIMNYKGWPKFSNEDLTAILLLIAKYKNQPNSNQNTEQSK
jgi:hypothetical protein